MIDPQLREFTPVPEMTVSEGFLSGPLRTWAPDLYSFPFLSRSFVELLMRVGDEFGRWEPEEGDPYGAPELRLRKISPGLEDVLAEIIKRHVNPLLRRLYLGCYEIGWIQPPFLIRYDMHRQQDMGLHFDAESELTLSVLLDDGFEGGGVELPRQGFRSTEIPVGHALMFPGGITHLHRALPITAGERCTLTIWTQQDAPG